MIDITKYAEAYRRIKNDNLKQRYSENFFDDLFSRTYTAVCLDVDKTIRNYEIIDKEMLDVFSMLLERNTSLCFVTGMGRTKSREVLTQIYQYMKDNKVDVKNITCATSNGAVFLETSKSFLDREEIIVKDTTLKSYTQMKDTLRKEYLSNITNLGIAETNNIQELIARSIKSSGDMSLRFVFDYGEVKDQEGMTLALKEVLSKTDLAEEVSVLKGKHKDKLIWELSVADKLGAVHFFERKYGIKDKDVVKLGDQGKKNGNDYNMLKSYAGFSVDEIETEEAEVLPVIDDNGEIMKGPEATKRILKDLNFDGER